jgi:hypothetical protein
MFADKPPRYMQQITKELGQHKNLCPDALTKYEVGAALCKAANIAGLWAIPEYEIVLRNGKTRKIDVVWARRMPNTSPEIWAPVAAFEIEGRGVHVGSIKKDAESLDKAREAGAVVCAIVLFQAGPDGEIWNEWITRDKAVPRVKSKLPPTAQLDVVLDEGLPKKLPNWARKAQSANQSMSRTLAGARVGYL